MFPTGRTVTENDVPEHGWLRSGVFLSEEQIAIVNEARQHKRVTTLDENGAPLYSVTRSYLLYVRQFAQAAGLPDALMEFDISGAGEILIARWRLPGERGLVIDSDAVEVQVRLFRPIEAE